MIKITNQANLKFQMMSDNLQVGILKCRVDEYLSIEEMNDGFVQLSGYTAEDMNIVLRTVCRRVFTKRIYRYFKPCRRGSRREKYMLRQNFVFLEKTGQPAGTVCLSSHNLMIRESLQRHRDYLQHR